MEYQVDFEVKKLHMILTFGRLSPLGAFEKKIDYWDQTKVGNFQPILANLTPVIKSSP